MRTLTEIAFAELDCPLTFCAGQRGHGCTSRTGRRARALHSARVAPLYAAWRLGYGHGGEWVVDLVERRCSPDRADLDPRGTLEKALAIAKRGLS